MGTAETENYVFLRRFEIQRFWRQDPYQGLVITMTANGPCPPHFPPQQIGTILKSYKSSYAPLRTKFTMVQLGQGSGFLQKSSASKRVRKQKTQIGLTVENGKTRNTIVENGKTQAELTQDKSVFLQSEPDAADAYYWLVTTFLSHVTKYSTRLTWIGWEGGGVNREEGMNVKMICLNACLCRVGAYLIFVTGATGGARVIFFLAGVNFFQMSRKKLAIYCVNWQFTV